MFSLFLRVYSVLFDADTQLIDLKAINSQRSPAIRRKIGLHLRLQREQGSPPSHLCFFFQDPVNNDSPLRPSSFCRPTYNSGAFVTSAQSRSFTQHDLIIYATYRSQYSLNNNHKMMFQCTYEQDPAHCIKKCE